MRKTKKRAAYLSGAPRISTSIDAENSAARNHVLEVIRAFEHVDINVDKYVLGDHLPNKLTRKGSERIANKSLLHRIATDVFRLILYYQNQIRAKKIIDLKGLDFVYERFALMQMVGWTFKKRNIPWLLETNAILSEEAYYESKTLYLKSISEWIEKRAYKKCSVLVCVSENLKNSIVAKYGINSEKIYVMKNGVNVDKFNFDPSYHPDSTSFIIGYVGSLSKWQSLDTLIKVLPMLIDRNIDVRLKIVGDGPEMQNLKRLSEKLNVKDQVEFTGHISPDCIPDLIRTFSIGYCNPNHKSNSTSEAFNSPMKLYEYLAIGKPVLAKKNYDTDSLVGSQAYIFELESNSVESVAEGALHFYNIKNNLNYLGRIAANEIVSNHSWNQRINGLLKFVKE